MRESFSEREGARRGRRRGAGRAARLPVRAQRVRASHGDQHPCGSPRGGTIARLRVAGIPWAAALSADAAPWIVESRVVGISDGDTITNSGVAGRYARHSYAGLGAAWPLRWNEAATNSSSVSRPVCSTAFRGFPSSLVGNLSDRSGLSFDDFDRRVVNRFRRRAQGERTFAELR
jgi:hypothetical protein